MIRIKLLDGETVETQCYTYDEALRVRAASEPIVVGGPGEAGRTACACTSCADINKNLFPPERTIYPEAVASIEQVAL